MLIFSIVVAWVCVSSALPPLQVRSVRGLAFLNAPPQNTPATPARAGCRCAGPAGCLVFHQVIRLCQKYKGNRLGSVGYRWGAGSDTQKKLSSRQAKATTIDASRAVCLDCENLTH